jgi:hypothetical protein
MGQGCWASDKEVKTPPSESQNRAPRMLQDSSDRETVLHSFWEASLLSRLTVTQWISIQRLSSKSKGGFPYVPFRAGYRNWGYSLSHTWSHTISLVILTSGARWPFSGLTPGAMWHSSNPSFAVVVSLLHSLSPSLSFFPLPAFLPHLSLPHYEAAFS